MVGFGRSRNFAVIAALSFIGGIPFYFFVVALPVVLRTAGISLEVVSLTYLIWLPLAFKFAWGALIDRFSGPFVGGEKGWLMACVAAIAALSAISAFLNPASGLFWILFLGLLIACACAVLQVALGAFIVRSIQENQRGWANALQGVGASAGAMIGGGVFLVLFEETSWRLVLIIQALLVGVIGSLSLLIEDTEAIKQNHRGFLASGAQLVGRTGFPRLVLALVIGNMALGSDLVIGPYLFDIGVSASEIGVLTGIVGMALVFAASGAGGWLASRLGASRSLIIALLIKGALLATLAFFEFGFGGEVSAKLSATLAYGWSGATLVAFWTVYMKFADENQAGTDYGAFTSIEVVAFLLGGALAGFVAGQFGYAIWFGTAAACLVAAAGIIAGMRHDLIETLGSRPTT